MICRYDRKLPPPAQRRAPDSVAAIAEFRRAKSRQMGPDRDVARLAGLMAVQARHVRRCGGLFAFAEERVSKPDSLAVDVGFTLVFQLNDAVSPLKIAPPPMQLG